MNPVEIDMPMPITVNGHWHDCGDLVNGEVELSRGFFETILVSGNCLPLKHLHWRRAKSSAERMQMSFHVETLECYVRDYLYRLQQSFPQSIPCALKIAFVASTPELEAYGFSPATTNVLIQARRFSSIDRGLILQTCHTPLPVDLRCAGIKKLDRNVYRIAAAEIEKCDDGLLLSEQGFAIETLIRNIYWVEDECVYTPDLSQCGVEGVLKTFIKKEVLPELGLPMLEIKTTPQRIYSAREIFASNAIRGVQPVLKLDEKRWREGGITKKITEIVNTKLNNAFT